MTETGHVTHVVVGYGNLAAELDRHLTGARLLILEEPAIIAARGVPGRVSALPSAVGLLPAPTQSESDDDLRDLIAAVPRPDGVRAVVPVNEYAVVAAAALAEAWGLPGAGLAASRCFRDKARLRETAKGAGVRQPDWQLATGPEDVREFQAAHGGAGVLKPANRQASLGVRLLAAGDSAEDAWRAATGVDESLVRTHRVPPPRYLLEERLSGPEVSVEALVLAGEVVFENVTAKAVQAGPYPVELGQRVPADLPAEVGDALRAGLRELVRATGFGTGVLHAEWILVGGRDPHLVECAARMPGDNIPHLISLAYDTSLFRAYATVLEGRRPDLPGQPACGAAIHFLTAAPGVVRAVSGVERALAAGAYEAEVDVEPGDRVAEVISSWQRAGQVMAVGADGAAAAARAAELAAGISIVTDQEPSSDSPGRPEADEPEGRFS